MGSGNRVLGGVEMKQRRVRDIGAFVAYAGVLAAACSVAGDGSSEPVDATVPGSPAASAPDTTSTTEAPSSSTEPPPTTAAGTVPIDPDALTLRELDELAAEGELTELDLALAEFAFLTDVEIDGALPVRPSGLDPDELTHVVDRLAAFDDELSDAQREQIDAALAEIVESARLVYRTGDEFDAGESDADENAAGPDVGFASMTRSAKGPLTDEELIKMVISAQQFVLGQLGGEPPDLSVSLIAPEDREEYQRNWAGWARTTEDVPGERRCAVVIVDFPDETRERIRATVVHEYFHCWHARNTPGQLSVYRGAPGWVVEGLAEWVENEASTAGNGSGWAEAFLDAKRGRLFRERYGAVGFYWQLNYFDGGSDALWDRIPSIIAQTGSAAAFAAATAGLTTQELALLAPTSTRKIDWGPLWTFDHPRLTGGARPIRIEPVRGAAAAFAGPGEQVVVEFDYTGASTGEPLIIEVVQVGLAVWAWNLQPTTAFTENQKTTWCLGAECLCPDGTPPFEDLRPIPGGDERLTMALTGTGSERASAETRLLKLDDVCEPDDDGELVGTWIADPTALIDAYAEAYAEIGTVVTGVSGELSMTIGEGGAVELVYREVSLRLDNPVIDTIVVNGRGKLEWSAADGRLVFSDLADLDLAFTTPGVSDDPLRITEDLLRGEDGTTTIDYAIDGASLSLSNVTGSLTEARDGAPGVLVFPATWTRSVSP